MERVDKVVWNPGNFGHLLIKILEAHHLDRIPEIIDEVHSHKEPDVSGYIKIQHSFDYNKHYDGTWIKPFFSAPHLKYFPFYCNHVKYQMPKSIRVDIEDFVRTYWNFQEPLIPKNNIDMGTFFSNTDAWIESLEMILTEKISKGIKDFIHAKAELNQKLLQQFLDKSKSDSGILLAIRICEHIDGNKDKFTEFVKSLDSKEDLSRYV